MHHGRDLEPYPGPCHELLVVRPQPHPRVLRREVCAEFALVPGHLDVALGDAALVIAAAAVWGEELLFVLTGRQPVGAVMGPERRAEKNWVLLLRLCHFAV